MWIVKRIAPGIGLGVLAAAGLLCAQSAWAAEHDKYLSRIVANTTYSRGVADGLRRNVHVPKHKPEDIEAQFNENKAEIVAPLVAYLKTFDGGEYPGICIEMAGIPLRTDARKTVFHMTVRATVRPRPDGKPSIGVRPRVDDRYLAAVLWDPVAKSVERVWLNSCSLGSVPPAALHKALKIAGKHDPRYAGRQPGPYDVQWLPPWYLDQQLFKRSPNERNKSAYSYITEDTNHNIVLLRFRFPEETTKRNHSGRHTVAIDIELGKVVGIERTTVYDGPVFRP